jgi:hypothetical protein
MGLLRRHRDIAEYHSYHATEAGAMNRSARPVSLSLNTPRLASLHRTVPTFGENYLRQVFEQNHQDL